MSNYSRLFVIVSERKFLELLSVTIRNKFFKNGMGVLPSFNNKKVYVLILDQCFITSYKSVVRISVKINRLVCSV